VLTTACFLSHSLELTHETGARYTFELYKTQFKKSYPERHRHDFHAKVFQKNLAKIMAHNSDPTQTWKMVGHIPH
jgi:hypothetical protein